MYVCLCSKQINTEKSRNVQQCSIYCIMLNVMDTLDLTSDVVWGYRSQVAVEHVSRAVTAQPSIIVCSVHR